MYHEYLLHHAGGAQARDYLKKREIPSGGDRRVSTGICPARLGFPEQ